MKKMFLLFSLFFSLIGFVSAEEEVKAFHPTDALLIGGNGPFNPGGEYGNQPEPEVKGFHPTDALLIGGNGPFNPGAEYEGQ